MAVSMKNLDPAFQNAGQKAGIEIWRIENFRPVPVPKESYGKFFSGDSYVVLKTSALKSGTFRHEIHFWLGKDTSQDEAGTASIKTVELDAALGGRAVQYRELQGHESEKFLSYFRPCIIPREGGVASGFKHVEPEEHQTRLFVCKGKYVVHVKEIPVARSSLNHEDIFILDTKSKIFQFNGSNSSIQERAKALEVVQYIKDTYHDGKCEISAIEDGKLMADAQTGEFWAFFGGFAPLPRKSVIEVNNTVGSHSARLICVENGPTKPIDAESLTRELLDTNKCYILDRGDEVFVWMGRNTSLDQRKSASKSAEEFFASTGRSKFHCIRVIEGFETLTFRSQFESWPPASSVTVSEEGRSKVAALLKRQGLNVKGLMKTSPTKEEPLAYIDVTGNLQVWRINGDEKISLSSSDQSKFYSGDCYIFQYTYPGEVKEDCLIGTWFGKQSVEEERASAKIMVNKMVESSKLLPAQAQFYEGSESILFYTIFQNFIVFKGGLGAAYKNHIMQNDLQDDTYSEDSLALFRVQGSGPDNMQAIQVEPIASSLNSAYCYILHNDTSVYTWSGSLTTTDDQELIERQLDVIKPNVQSKPQKEGSESEQFWSLLGGISEYPSQKIARESESDPNLFSCTFSKGNLKVSEIYNFTQDDLMTEDSFILDCHSEIFVWVGQQVDAKNKTLALTMGEKFLEQDFLSEKLSRETPIYVVMEGSEPPFFTRFFSWDSAKSAMRGNSFERKLSIIKNGGVPLQDKPKRRSPVSYGGRSSVPDKSQRSRSMSFSPDRVRVRGRSPAFNALAANFENPNARNLSTPPPVAKKLFPKSSSPDSAQLASKSSSIAAISSAFEQPPPARQFIIPKSIKGYSKWSPAARETNCESDSKENAVSNRMETLTIQEDVKEGEVEDEAGLILYSYEQIKVNSLNPVADIDVTKRESYLCLAEFREKFGMTKDSFYKLPKWKQNKLKMALQLF